MHVISVSSSQNGGGCTPNYAAPEQYSKSAFGPVGPKADVWALAATALHLLTGVPPFKGKRFEDINDALVNARRPPPVPAGLPPLVAALLAECLSIVPGRRPTTAEVVARLEAARRAAEAAAPPR
jgi:serine/threonine-protein kinase